MEKKSAVSASLGGDWTVTGLIDQIDPLTKLSSQLDLSTPNVHVDCSHIEGIDVCGFQLLYTWLHCLTIRGFQPTLVKVPEAVQKSHQLLGLDNIEFFKRL